MDEGQKNEDRRVKKTRSAINDAFQSLLLEKKYSKITVKELTERADITRKTFYLHYGTLDDVLREFLAELFSDVRGEFIKQESDPVEIGVLSEMRIDEYSELFDRLNQNFEKEHIKMMNLINDDVGRQIVYRFVMERQKLLWENYREQYGLSPEVVRLYWTYTTYGFITMYMSWYSDPDSVPAEKFLEISQDISASMRGLLKKWQDQL